jgi:helicase
MDAQKTALELSKIPAFNPMQAKALKKGCLSKSVVVSSPTASGKTLLAEMAALESIANRKRKVVYTCPLRALATEHFSEFKKKYSKELNIRAALSTGELDSSSKHLQNYDVIFTTYEKLDSLLRHRSEWLASIGLLVIDEVHMLATDRGPTIEMAVTKLRFLNQGLQVLALSATIPNSSEIAEWLDAELVESSYRPIPLKEGVFFNQEIEYASGKPETLELKEPIKSLVKDTLIKKEKQAMVFANTRKRAESIADQLSLFVEKELSQKEKNQLKKESQAVLNALEQPTEQCKRLSNLVAKGVAFHHAGLLYKQRTVIEDLFRNNKIKLISATPTLAAGVNLPSHTVIIPSLFRYTAAGMVRIPVSEYKQQVGRAGRPKYDKEGRGIVIARSEAEKDELLESYTKGSLEPVESKLGFEPVLRMHMLALVASGFVFDLESMEQFFKKTFYAKQFGEMQSLFEKLQSVLEQLQEMGFIQADEKRIEATALGKRVSELYLDPQSAFEMISGLKTASKFSPFSYLFLLSNCSELMPWLSVPKAREPELWEGLQARKLELPVDLEREMFFDLNLLRKFNTASMFEHWIQEAREQEIMNLFKTQPGILHIKLNVCDWLCYSCLELARLLKLEMHYMPLSKLRKRLKHGVKEELLMLTEVRYIGRVRARRLWRSNLRTIADLKKVDEKDLARILGQGVARNVKAALGYRKLY